MSQFPVWDRQFAAWSNSAQLRQDQLREIVSDLTTRGEETMSEVRAQALEYAEQARRRLEELPAALADEFRRRMNVLDLATKHDVEAQSKLGRKRVAAVSKDIRDEHRNHDEELLRTLRAELREELEIFAAAIADDLFSLDEPSTAPARGNGDSGDNFDEPLESEGAIELDSYDDPRFAGDDDIDRDDSEVGMRHSYLDTTDG